MCAPLVLTPRDLCACPELRPWPAHLPLIGVSVAASSRSCRKRSETSFLASDGRPRQGMGTAGGTRHDGSLQARASKSARLRAAVRRLSGVTARLRCLTARHAAGCGGKLKSPSGPAARRVPRAPRNWKFEKLAIGSPAYRQGMYRGRREPEVWVRAGFGCCHAAFVLYLSN